MPRNNWSSLNKQQLGAFAEYFVKMELTMHGFQVYGTEVDDRGIDFIARYEDGPFIEVQVKALRSSSGYVFMQKDRFPIRDQVYLAFALLLNGQEPELYLIPASAWTDEPSYEFLKSRDYEGLPSRPEWGLNVSKKSLKELGERFAFEQIMSRITQEAKNGRCSNALDPH